MSWLNPVLVTYAVLIVAGGLFAYFARGSAPSGIGSLAAGALVLIGVWLSGTNKNLGYGIAALVAIGLVAFFLYRAINGSMMPSVPVIIMSVAVLAGLYFALKE